MRAWPLDRVGMAAVLAAALPGLVMLRQAFTGYVGLAWLAFCIWHWRSLRGHPEGRRVLNSAFGWGFVLSVLLMILLLAIHQSGWGALHNPSRFILVLPMAIAVAVIKPSCRAYFAAVAIAGLIAGAVAVWQVLIMQTVGPEHAHLGFTNRNKFAYVAASLVLLSAAGLRLPSLQRPPSGLLWAGLAGALVALVLANTRGAWLAAALPLWIWLAASRAIPGRIGLIAVLVSMLFALLLAAMPGSPVRARIEQGYEQYQRYQPGLVQRDESISERLEMWRASLMMARAHPWVGIGPGRFNEALQPLIGSGRISPAVTTQGHPHNEYLSALATGGMVGLIALLAALGGPLLHFVRRARQASAQRSVQGACALAGALLAACTAVFCVTDPFFYIHFSTLYYALSLALLAGFVESVRGSSVS